MSLRCVELGRADWEKLGRPNSGEVIDTVRSEAASPHVSGKHTSSTKRCLKLCEDISDVEGDDMQSTPGRIRDVSPVKIDPFAYLKEKPAERKRKDISPGHKIFFWGI